MAAPTTRSLDGVAYREALPEGWDRSGPTILLLHGYPTSSYLWRNVMPEAAAAGWRAIAPDLPGFGDSPADLPGTWERQVEHVERFRRALGLEQVALAVHRPSRCKAQNSVPALSDLVDASEELALG